MTGPETLEWVASELRRLAPAAATPPDGDSHQGRRAFQEAADVLDLTAADLRVGNTTLPPMPSDVAWDGGVGA